MRLYVSLKDLKEGSPSLKDGGLAWNVEESLRQSTSRLMLEASVGRTKEGSRFCGFTVAGCGKKRQIRSLDL